MRVSRATIPEADRSDMWTGVRLPWVLAALTCAAFLAAGCGDDTQSGSTAEPAASPSAASDAAGSTSPAEASAAPSWRDYFPPRRGYECAFVATLDTGSLRVVSRQTQTVASVRSAADGQHVVIRTRSVTTAPGIRPVTLKVDSPYVFAEDGRLRSAPGLASAAGLRVTYDGFQVFPSVPDLRRGRSARSKVALSMSATSDAMRRALADELGGRTSFKADLEYEVSAAPSRRAIVTPAGRYTDVLGIAIRLKSFQLRNAESDLDAAASDALRGLLGNGSTSYYAKGVGLVLAEASGSVGTTTMQLRDCAGS